MAHKAFAPVAFSVFLALAGCAVAHRGDHVVKYDSSLAPNVTEATVAGTYALYASTDVAPKITVALEKGDKIGFERTDSGMVRAIAGSMKPIEFSADKTYYWKRL